MRSAEDIRKLTIAAVIDRLTYRRAPTFAVSETSELAGSGLDSLDLVELWMDLEERLGWSLPEHDVRSAKTLGDLVRIAEESQPGAPGTTT